MSVNLPTIVDPEELLDSLPDIVFETDESLNVIYSNEAARALGLAPGELRDRGLTALDIIAPVDRSRLQARANELLSTPGVSRDVVRVELRSGEQVWFEVLARSVVRDGRLVGIRGSMRNVTARQLAQEQLAVAVRRLSLVNEIAHVLSSTLDPKAVMRLMLQEVARVIAADRIHIAVFSNDSDRVQIVAAEGSADDRELEQTTVPRGDTVLAKIMLSPPSCYLADLLLFEAPWVKRLAQAGLRSAVIVPIVSAGACLGTLNVCRVQVDAFTGDERDLLQSLAPYAAAAIRNARAYEQLREARSRLAEAQSQVFRVERLRCIGEVAGGVAHDMNNLLATILSRAQVLLHDLEDPLLRANVQAIEAAARDGRESVKRIQKFGGRISEDAYTAVLLDDLIAEAVSMTSYRWKDVAQRNGVTIVVHKKLNLGPPVRANPAEIREVLVNLILNACDAMQRGGALILRSREEAGWGLVEVSDTGEGMDADTLAHAFDLFFTTKSSENTGLGLTISRGIMQRHGGRLEAASVLAEGTTFTLWLPLHQAEMEAVPAAGEEAAPALSERLRVLVVDDDALVRGALGDAVECLGGEATVAADGRAAVELVAGQRFDVVLTDLGMPEMSGWQVAEEVKRLSPGTRVVVLTGWGDSLAPNPCADETLGKPVEMSTLAEVLGRVTVRRAA